VDRPCAALPHEYWQLEVRLCPHLRDVAVTVRGWREDGGDDGDYLSRTTVLGPFDGLDELRTRLLQGLDTILFDVHDRW
jgi:hypothetical protein